MYICLLNVYIFSEEIPREQLSVISQDVNVLETRFLRVSVNT